MGHTRTLGQVREAAGVKGLIRSAREAGEPRGGLTDGVDRVTRGTSVLLPKL